MLSVGDGCGEKYLCKVSTLRLINKKVIELIFKLNIPFIADEKKSRNLIPGIISKIQRIQIQKSILCCLLARISSGLST